MPYAGSKIQKNGKGGAVAACMEKKKGKEQALTTVACWNMKKTLQLSWVKEGLFRFLRILKGLTLLAVRKKKACKETGVSLQAEAAREELPFGFIISSGCIP
ncbi:hypothetical protein [Halobacillus litoralis]|uniref:hypothetical protein n=1 Tax=Halobacillus litoralis TaxID=45668 RepID=UPI001CD28DAB|nr:hypothetical protein [Halobacillus litoralis]MCA1021114.1 hypothetical protein [Halobacillus litoralis]